MGTTGTRNLFPNLRHLALLVIVGGEIALSGCPRGVKINTTVHTGLIATARPGQTLCPVCPYRSGRPAHAAVLPPRPAPQHGVQAVAAVDDDAARRDPAQGGRVGV